MRNVYLVTLFVCVLAVSLLGFRGHIFTQPPMDVFPEWAFPGMKYQPKLRPQSHSDFFADGRADRPPPAHTVMRGMFEDKEHNYNGDDDALYAGKDAAGQWLKGFPTSVTVDLQLLERGRNRYEIYCSPCHGLVGDGNGMTKKYGMGTTPSYHDEQRRKLTEGEIFNTITHGTANKNMQPYADKLVPEDRWAVVAYVRALQRAQQGTAADVTDANERKKLGLQ
jgi:mono/diheme cytochrome c family protein